MEELNIYIFKENEGSNGGIMVADVYKKAEYLRN